MNYYIQLIKFRTRICFFFNSSDIIGGSEKSYNKVAKANVLGATTCYTHILTRNHQLRIKHFRLNVL